MPWTTPTIQDLRTLNRANVTALLRSGPIIPNSVLRIIADANAGMAYLTLLYLNWLSDQLLPDTAEDEWLVRFANIWGVSVASSTFASGTVYVSGINGVVIPYGAQITGTSNSVTGGQTTVIFQVAAQTTIGVLPTPVPVVALTAGETGLVVGNSLSFSQGIAGINGSPTIAAFTDGINGDTEDEIRANVLRRIRMPPMGGDGDDYVSWVMALPGVTRAWCSPQELGIGTVTLRFMMDEVQASSGGFPTQDQVNAVQTAIDVVRPVTVKDFYVVAPLPWPINFTLTKLVNDDSGTVTNLEKSVTSMLLIKAAPASARMGVPQAPTTIYATWVSDAVSQAAGVDEFDITMSDAVPPNNGSLAVLGTVTLR
jgi:uncharacterized phage protein gp47/JayE